MILSVIVEAQTNKKLSYLYQEKLQQADDNFNLLNYKLAVNLYQQVLEKAGEDTAIICKIANSFRLLNDFKNAEEFYRRAIVGNENTIGTVFKFQFAQVLTINEKYDEALYWFRSYYKNIGTDKRADEIIRSIENMSKLYYDTAFYVAYPISINTQYAEFSPVYYKNGLLFLSDRKSGKVSRFFSAIDTSGNLAEPAKFSTEIKTDYNEGASSFYDNFRKMIFSQNYFSDKISRKKINDIPLQLFSAQRDSDNAWKDIKLLPFEDKNYSYSQPSITEDGNKLYFSSNMPGGFGGTDLYMSIFENGSWSRTLNLGTSINTKSDEMFPFIYQDSLLYFSSSGHGGMGGLDLFKMDLKDTGSLENLGVPMNSANDDFGIIIDKDGLSGYFASNRSNGMGDDDIYRFKVIRITVTLKIIDENTALPVSNADIYSVSDNNKIGKTNQEGLVTMVIPVCKSFQVRIEKENYESKIYTLESVKSSNNQLSVIHIKSELKPKEETIILTDENNKPIDNPKNVVYKVQILANRTPVSDIALKRKYKGALNVNNFYEDRWYKYSIGEYSSYAEAKSCVYSCNVYDAFIIAYVNQKKVHISIAKAATKESEIEYPARTQH